MQYRKHRHMPVTHTFPSAPLSMLLLCVGRRGDWAHSYCAGGPWGSCLILVQISHLKLVGLKVSFPVFFLLLFSLIYSAMGFLSFLSRSGGYFVPPPPRVCMHVCIFMWIYERHSWVQCPVPFLSQTFGVTHNLPIREDLLLVWGTHWSTGRQASLTEFMIWLGDSCLEPVCRSHIVRGFVPIILM